MEASALPASVGLTRARLGLGAPLLRLRSDEQLVSLFRAGNEDAFRVIHDRYRSRMLAYARQMLSASPADAEDAVQEVFVRAYAGLRANRRDLALRAWLYRIAHNRCIDDLRRPHPIAVEEVESLGEAAAGPDPHARVEQREALRRLIADVQRLPEQQRSALLMRELAGMPYADLAGALGVSVPAVKSLLVRARVGLVAASEARDTACATIREDMIVAHDRGVRASGRARRHLRDCAECRGFRTEVQGVSRNLGLLLPVLGPLGVLAKLAGLCGLGGLGGGSGAAAGSGTTAAAAAGGTAATAAAGGSAAAGGTIAAGTTAAAAGTTAAAAGTTAVASTGALASVGAAAGAGHVATIIAATAIAAGGAIGIQHAVSSPRPAPAHHATVVAALPSTGSAPAAVASRRPVHVPRATVAPTPTPTPTPATTSSTTTPAGAATNAAATTQGATRASGRVTELASSGAAGTGSASSPSSATPPAPPTAAPGATSTDPTSTTSTTATTTTGAASPTTGTIADPTAGTTATPIPGSGTQTDPTTSPTSASPARGNPGTATGIVPTTVSSATTWSASHRAARRMRVRTWRYALRGVRASSSTR